VPSARRRCSLFANATTAKHLEQLKGGRFPIEILVRGKDQAENDKLWVTITDKIKAAGVRGSFPSVVKWEKTLTDSL
jgi:hypothetical protein